MGAVIDILKATEAIRKKKKKAPERPYGWDAVYGEGAAGISEQTKADMAKAGGRDDD